MKTIVFAASLLFTSLALSSDIYDDPTIHKGYPWETRDQYKPGKPPKQKLKEMAFYWKDGERNMGSCGAHTSGCDLL